LSTAPDKFASSRKIVVKNGLNYRRDFDMVRKILKKVPEEQLQRNLEKYRQRAIELGATDTKIITTDDKTGIGVNLLIEEGGD